MAQALQISKAEFQAEVLDSQIPVLVDFWAPWCGPCRMVAPVLEEIAADYAEKLKLVKVNVDENPDLAGAYGVMSIPTMMLFKNGDAVDRMVGFAPKAELAKRIDSKL